MVVQPTTAGAVRLFVAGRQMEGEAIGQGWRICNRPTVSLIKSSFECSGPCKYQQTSILNVKIEAIQQEFLGLTRRIQKFLDEDGLADKI